MNFTFEELKLEHREEVISIFNYYVKETTSAFREDVVENEFFSYFVDEEKYCGFVIKDEQGEIVGFCTLEPYMAISAFSEAAEPMYFIHHEHTGRGIGTLILNRLEEEARKRGIKKLLADISSENSGSIAFHKKNGFTECGRFQDIGKKFGRYFSIVWMQKDICSE